MPRLSVPGGDNNALCTVACGQHRETSLRALPRAVEMVRHAYKHLGNGAAGIIAPAACVTLCCSSSCHELVGLPELHGNIIHVAFKSAEILLHVFEMVLDLMFNIFDVAPNEHHHNLRVR